MSSFEEIISSHCSRLYNLSLFVTEKGNRDVVLSRRFLGRFQLEATWMEETMDAAGARKSEKWFPFREGVSAIKMLTSVTYDLLHIINSAPYYNLIEIKQNMAFESSKVLDDLYGALFKTSSYLVKKAIKCGLHKNEKHTIDRGDFEDIKDMAFVKKDRKLRHIDNPGKTLIYLATEFINLKSEIKLFEQLADLERKKIKEYIPDSISEDKIRLVLARFHNLQSLYDTYLSESDIEDVDPRLKVLRGHISMIYHMIKSATKFTHYYERHIMPWEGTLFFKTLLPMDIKRFLDITINFFMSYPVYYFDAAKEMCFKVIQSYAEIEEKLIPIPEYRGFHVRPSTLISKIVNYYGGKVKFEFNGTLHDPSTTLELFRLNEEINAQKRKQVLNTIESMDCEYREVETIFNELECNGHIIIYNRELDFQTRSSDESNRDYIKRLIELFLASGKIDINIDLKIKFIGDKRSLNDIEILATSGYGEDRLGNNIALPQKLSYLKR